MSAIYKLSIQGIRSFDSNDRETIEFGKPLTLIVGMNGSGKTTIIECLKYATTGDLPPNSKGGVFIHDPKITGEKDIRAQVKLAFTSANGLNMIVTRNIQLLMKKTTATFKTLEGQLVAINNSGDRSTLSTRSLELDAQVPLYLGVPKAILEYVIFCHQEDSLWPLSEPSNLKKKFDEIFQAMKFTKALDNLKSIKKDMSVDIKLLKQSVEHLKLDKDRSKAMKLNIHQLQSKIDQFNAEVSQIEAQLNEITEQSDKLFKSNQDFQKILSKVENLKNSKTSIRDQVERLSNSIEILDLSKMDLKNLLANFSKVLTEKNHQLKDLEMNISNLKNQQSSLQNHSNSLIRRQGELEARKEAYEKNLSHLASLKEDFQQRFQHLSDNNNSDMVKTNQEMSQFQVRIFQDLSNTAEQFAKEILIKETNVSELVKSITVDSQNLEYNKKDRTKLIHDTEELTEEVRLLKNLSTQDDLNHELENLNTYKGKLQAWENDNTIPKLTQKIEEKNNEMIILENQIEKFQDRIMKTNQQADLYAKLGLVRKSLNVKSGDLQNIIEKLQKDPKIRQIFPITQDFQKSDLEIDFQKLFINMQKNIAVNNKEIHEFDRKYTNALYNSNTIEKDLHDNLHSQQKVIQLLNENLPEDCTIDEYNDVLEETELSYKTALENLKMHQTTLEFNRKALEIAERDSCCYLCSRKFENESFKSKLLQELKTKTDANFEKTLKETVQNEKEYLDSLRLLEKHIISLNSLCQKIENAQEALDKAKEETKASKTKLDLLETKSTTLKNEKEFAESEIRPLIEKFIYLEREVKELEHSSKTISDELSIYNTSEDGIKTVDELRDQQRKMNDSLRELRKNISDLQMEKDEKVRENSRMINLIKEKELNVSEIESSLTRKQNIDNSIKLKKANIKDIDSRIEALESQIISLQNKKNEAQNVLDITKNERDLQINNKQKIVADVNRLIDRFQTIHNEAIDFESRGFNELQKTVIELESNKVQMKELKEQLDSRLNEMNEEKRKLADSNNEEKNLKQNLELIELKSQLHNIEAEINELDVQNAEAERDKYQEESLRLRTNFEKLSSENAGKLGEMKQLQNQIDSLTHQLRTDYKDVEKSYHKEWVELQTRSFVTDDIDVYSKALDSAIMKYHGLKMQDINRIIDELWKRTYSGTDIDTIKIRSDEVSSTVKGKSYNYRVVMYKQDVELDMRGRCSAGQKVIASIIIRLALSETFGANCGVIALDEPTTNLDEENIESLAKSLHNIINMRRHQKNFQLIVITHDEKFLGHMNAAAFTDHFFKVKRDDRQKSQIEWVDINRVTY
ncbi:DNA repair protein rad50 [Saccharomyces pastorianus]|uniref:DNA repair protein RAD50 n=1 Tax=Saccharomyces pastorianus TaxID=27292 RepID=A0SQ62_SACPS|nr:RAD50 [Saccharomyces pastorianus]QID87547.1 DNA repair protein rad50 [Saccharomyces pastorianus]